MKTSADRDFHPACGLSWPDETQHSSSGVCDISALLHFNQYTQLKGRCFC